MEGIIELEISLKYVDQTYELAKPDFKSEEEYIVIYNTKLKSQSLWGIIKTYM